MGHDELKQALVREAEERVRALWEEAEEEVSDLRERLARHRSEEQEAAHRQLETALADLHAAGERQAAEIERRIELDAQGRLCRRLLSLAGAMLTQLVGDDRERCFGLLAGELPKGDWTEVTVHPDDEAFARSLLPQAAPTLDAGVSGGLIVRADGGRIRVDNSLDKRLARLWPELLPVLVEEAARRAAKEDDEPAAKKT